MNVVTQHWHSADPLALTTGRAEFVALAFPNDLPLGRISKPEPREDHAQYLQSWLRVLKADKRAIFTAASKAQQACDWMIQRAGARSLEVAA